MKLLLVLVLDLEYILCVKVVYIYYFLQNVLFEWYNHSVYQNRFFIVFSTVPYIAVF